MRIVEEYCTLDQVHQQVRWTAILEKERFTFDICKLKCYYNGSENSIL